MGKKRYNRNFTEIFTYSGNVMKMLKTFKKFQFWQKTTFSSS